MDSLKRAVACVCVGVRNEWGFGFVLGGREEGREKERKEEGGEDRVQIFILAESFPYNSSNQMDYSLLP